MVEAAIRREKIPLIANPFKSIDIGRSDSVRYVYMNDDVLRETLSHMKLLHWLRVQQECGGQRCFIVLV